MGSNAPFPWVQYFEVVIGILISIVLPILRRQLPSPPALLGALPQTKTYLIIGLFSLLTAVLIVAFGGVAVSTWQWFTAVLAGYAWDSTLQKIVKG
jgi:hypothetical protein